jgi:hypothetical protein
VPYHLLSREITPCHEHSLRSSDSRPRRAEGAVPGLLTGATFLNGGRYWDRTSGPCRVKRG